MGEASRLFLGLSSLLFACSPSAFPDGARNEYEAERILARCETAAKPKTYYEIIPVDLSLDLMEFFGNRGYEDLLNLAFAIGGVNGSSSKLRLGARVTVETPLGDVEYPNELTIVNASFTN